MTRIAGVSVRSAGPLVKLVYIMARRQVGRLVDPVTVYAYAPSLLINYGLLERATARQTQVGNRLKALAELKAATVVNCEFCVDIGSSLAREAGIGENELLALANYRESDAFDTRERLVLQYAEAMSRSPASVDGDLFSALREQFSERQLVELTHAIALENMRARFNSAFDMTPGGFSAGMACPPMAPSTPAESKSPARAARVSSAA